jgi:7-carboxy-7-deazaguanine synthase
MTVYPVVEKFKAVQGEGLFTGTPMAFIRLKGCSVSKKICHHCDTDFDKIMEWKGGGHFEVDFLDMWAANYRHICITGGEPLNHDLWPMWVRLSKNRTIHIETSGTIDIKETGMAHVDAVHITVSPKPGYLESMIKRADEIKVIVGGLGSGEGWPTLNSARVWAAEGKLVYLQPVNKKNEPDKLTLSHALELVDAYPELRLSVQLHKYIGVR